MRLFNLKKEGRLSLIFVVTVSSLLLIQGAVFMVNAINLGNLCNDALESYHGMDDIEKSWYNLRIHMSAYLGTNNPDEMKILEKDIDDISAKISDRLKSNFQAEEVTGLFVLNMNIYRKIMELHYEFITRKAYKLFHADSQKNFDILKSLIRAEKENIRNLAIRQIAKASMKAAWVVGIFSIAGSLVGLMVGHRITRHVRLIVAGFKNIAKGDLTTRLQIYTKDEMGELATAFNIFIEKLRVIMKELANTTGSLSKSSEELSFVSVQMDSSAEETNSQASMVAASSEQISASVGTVAFATDRASASLSNIAAMTEEMSSAFNNVAGLANKTSDNVTRMAKSGKDMSTRTSTVASAVEEMTASLSEVAKNTARGNHISQNARQRTEQISTRMNALVASSVKIGKVLWVIRDIADQTNMLALNATIQAAGAGEAGKRFAVVAGEVKELAKQSADAADEISGQIENIQESVNDVFQAIEDMYKVSSEIASVNEMIAASVGEQTATANEISESIGGAAQTVKKVADDANESAKLVGDIARSTEETSETAAEIAGKIDEMLRGMKSLARSSSEASQGVDDISGNIQEISTASKQTAMSASRTSESSKKLAEMASALAQIVSQFKLDD